MDICREREPVFAKIADGHHVSCWKYAAGSSE